MARSLSAMLGFALISGASIANAESFAIPVQPASCANVTIASVAYSGAGCPSGSVQQSITNLQQTVALKFSKLSGANSACNLNIGVSYPQIGDYPCSSMASWTVSRVGLASTAGVNYPMEIQFANRTWGDHERANIATITAKDFAGDWGYAQQSSGRWSTVDTNNFTFADPGNGNSLSLSAPLAAEPHGWPTRGRKHSKRQDAVIAEAAETGEGVYTPSMLQAGQSQLSIEDELASISHGLGSSALWGKEKRQSTVARVTVNMKIALGVQGGSGSLNELDLVFATGVGDPTLF